MLERPLADLQMLFAHIGSGVSVCAMRDGKSVDTSMGFTPLEGAVMASRSGSVDPGALLWVQQMLGLDAAAMANALEHDAGLLALAGVSDVRAVELAAQGGNSRAAAALDVYIHALCRNLCAVASSLNRLDALVFTGGIGEHSALVRSRVCAGLGLIGVAPIDAAADGDTVVARARDCPAVLVVAAREDAEMAREARRLLRA
jgi:acetate kinase